MDSKCNWDQKLRGCLKETALGEDRIIEAYRREKPQHTETIVEYADGSISSFNIEGELGIESIPDNTNAIKVDIGTAVTSIGDWAFSDCSGLMSITIPDSVTSIGNSVFSRCSGLTSIIIPDSVTRIGRGAFSDCSELTSIMISKGVMSIGDYIFFGCSALSSITLLKTSAPTVQSNTFGDSTSPSDYTGRNTYSSGNNVLKVPQGATGYNSGAWLDPLQDATKCGFHIEYLD